LVIVRVSHENFAGKSNLIVLSKVKLTQNQCRIWERAKGAILPRASTSKGVTDIERERERAPHKQ
jgi:hypothetical protein